MKEHEHTKVINKDGSINCGICDTLLKSAN